MSETLQNRVCHVCGFTMTHCISEQTFNIGNCSFTVPDVEYYVCKKCGEVIYPSSSLKRIDEVVQKFKEESHGTY